MVKVNHQIERRIIRQQQHTIATEIFLLEQAYESLNQKPKQELSTKKQSELESQLSHYYARLRELCCYQAVLKKFRRILQANKLVDGIGEIQPKQFYIPVDEIDFDELAKAMEWQIHNKNQWNSVFVRSAKAQSYTSILGYYYYYISDGLFNGESHCEHLLKAISKKLTSIQSQIREKKHKVHALERTRMSLQNLTQQAFDASSIDLILNAKITSQIARDTFDTEALKERLLLKVELKQMEYQLVPLLQMIKDFLAIEETLDKDFQFDKQEDLESLKKIYDEYRSIEKVYKNNKEKIDEILDADSKLNKTKYPELFDNAELKANLATLSLMKEELFKKVSTLESHVITLKKALAGQQLKRDKERLKASKLKEEARQQRASLIEDFIADDGNLSLKAYLSQREDEYEMVDFLESICLGALGRTTQKEQRTKYIQNMISALEQFRETGDKTLVLQLVSEGLTHFQPRASGDGALYQFSLAYLIEEIKCKMNETETLSMELNHGG